MTAPQTRPAGAVVPFPVDAIRPAAPRVGGTLRGIICGRPVAGPITAKHHSFIAAGLVEGLEPTGRSFYFAEARWDATEFWLPVVELGERVRVLEWPHWPTAAHPVAFGIGTLPGELLAADEPPRIGGTLRAMIGGKVYFGRIDDQPATAVRDDLAELLQQTGRVSYFRQHQRCAFECFLPVIGLARPVRAVDWPLKGAAIVFGTNVLKVPLAKAPDLVSGTILPFARPLSRPPGARPVSCPRERLP